MSSNYLELIPSGTTQRALIEHELFLIRANNAKSIRLRIYNGKHLLNLKEMIGRGDWLSWLVEEANAGYHSARTAERDMALADVLYSSIDDLTDAALLEHTNLTALRVLIRDVNADALDRALALIRKGYDVKGEQANQLAAICEVDLRLADRVVAGELTLGDAAAIAARIAVVAPAHEVVDLIVRSNVRAPELVESLQFIYVNTPSSFDEIAASGFFYNPVTNQEIPLSEASRADGATTINYEEAEREGRKIEVLKSWSAGKPQRIADLRGTRADVLMQLAAAIPDDGREYHVYAYPEKEREAAAAGDPG